MDRPLFPSNTYGRIGIIARWQPVHLGHVPVLCALCDYAEVALIGIGSSNAYNYRSPFTLDETIDMIRLVLAGRQNYTLMAIPDLHDGPRWRQMVLEKFGSLDCFVTANPYVASLLGDVYPILHPARLVPEAKKIAVDGQLVRMVMARRQNWERLVSEPVASYIKTRQLDERFCREFGLQTLALESMVM